MNRAIYDKSVPTRNLVTTITGLIALVVPILVIVGLLTPEQSADLQKHGITIVESVGAIVGAISSIILIFKAKDA